MFNQNGSNMKHINAFIFLFSLLVVSCHKSTIIDGLVQDANTGSPIVGASVSIGLLLDKGHANSETSGFTGITDDNGRFYFEDKDILDIYYSEIRADGYGLLVYDFPKMNAHECNKPVFKLIPRDGVLKVQMENVTGTTDSLFFNATNDCDYLYYHFAYGQKPEFYPLWQGVNEHKFAYFNTCRGKPTYIVWSFDRNFSMPQRDTLEISMEDTTYYSFKY
jgi:hypothetical protein